MKPNLFRLLHLIRYRFFLFAGSLPYALGAAIAYYHAAAFNFPLFLAGLPGLIFAFAGVEIANEFFEPEDRVLYKDLACGPRASIWLGAGCFVIALSIAAYLAVKTGIIIIILAVLGFLIAYFYVGPPLRLIYRGLGEFVIFLAYGPLMVLGSYYMHSLKADAVAIFASFIPGALIFSLAVLNEVTDYYQDLLIGKRNILVRIGKKRGVALFIFVHLFSYLLIVFGVTVDIFPRLSLLALFGLPLAIKGCVLLRQHYDEPAKLIGAVNNAVLSYITANSLLIISLLSAAA